MKGGISLLSEQEFRESHIFKHQVIQAVGRYQFFPSEGYATSLFLQVECFVFGFRFCGFFWIWCFGVFYLFGEVILPIACVEAVVRDHRTLNRSHISSMGGETRGSSISSSLKELSGWWTNHVQCYYRPFWRLGGDQKNLQRQFIDFIFPINSRSGTFPCVPEQDKCKVSTPAWHTVSEVQL